MILDDCAVSGDVKRRTSGLVDLAFSGRHIGISLWVLTQQLTSIAKPFRENLGCIVAFHNPDKDSTDKLFSSFGSGNDREQKADVWNILKNNKHSLLQISLRHPLSYIVTIPNYSSSETKLEKMDYIREEEEPTRSLSRSPPTEPKTKRKYTRKTKVIPELEDDETRRKRDILASAACLENVEEYVGEKIKSIEFRNMSKERLEALFDLYQQKAEQELAVDGMKAAINVVVKALGYFSIELKDEDRLREELLDNIFLKITVGRQTSKIAEQYGDFVGVLKAVADACKHISFNASDPPEEVQEEQAKKPSYVLYLL